MKRIIVLISLLVLFISLFNCCSDKSNPVNNNNSQDNQQSAWSKKANMLNKRATFGSCVVDDKIYVIGGESMSGALSSLEMYDPETDTWSLKKDMPSKRLAFIARAVNNKIYAIGGTQKVLSSVPNDEQLKLVEEYDPSLDSWTSRSPMNHGRILFGACVVNNKIYVIGGWQNVTISSVEMYDPLTDTWVEKTNMPTKRGNISVSVIDNKIYVLGGDKGMYEEWTPEKIVEVYDPTTDTWSQSAKNMIIERCDFAACSCGEKIFVFGGVGNVLSTSSNSAECYNPQSNSWSNIQKMPKQIIGHNSVSVDGIIYIIGGYSVDNYLNTLYAYDPA